MKILVTAFGPFDGRSQNASSLALSRLKREFPRLNTRILPVDSVSGPQRLLRALRDLRPDALLMLGEAAGSSAIRLESTARNLMDFSIPDGAGRQPRGQRIDPTGPDSAESTLPLPEILADLESAGHAVSISDDAGSYLCNQVMYLALQWIAKHQLRCRAGFIHLPLAHDYPTANAVHALARVLGILKHVLSAPNQWDTQPAPTLKPS